MSLVDTLSLPSLRVRKTENINILEAEKCFSTRIGKIVEDFLTTTVQVFTPYILKTLQKTVT